MHLPKVSVRITSCNQQKFIEQTVLSAAEQDYDNLEVIVADDASTDHSPQILEAVQEKYRGRIKVFLYPDNIGMTRNQTRGLQQCTGELIATLDGDDIFLPGKISQQVEYLLSNPTCVLCYHDVEVFRSADQRVLYTWSQRFGHKQAGMKALVRYGNFLPSPSVMVRRQNVPAYGQDSRIRYGSDWLLWLEVLSGGGQAGYIDKVLSGYRRHAENITNTWHWRFEDHLVTLGLIAAKWPHLASAARLRQSEISLMHAIHCAAQKEYGNALDLLANSFFQGLPIFLPGLRLVWREILFSLKNEVSLDDPLKGLVTPL